MKKSGILIWVLTLVIVLILFVIPSKISRAVSPAIRSRMSGLDQNLVSFGKRFSGSLSLLFEIGDLRKENERLANELISGKVEQSKLAELLAENQSLKDQLKYKNENPNLKLVLASVVGLDPTNLTDTLIINRGTDDGVNPGMAVVYLGALVGKIAEANNATSQVVLITSKDSLVQVMLENTRTAGILRGGAGGMVLENIPLDTQISPNENLVTSGLGGKLPKGIFVGNAGDETGISSDIFKTILVKSPVNFSKLEYLFVVTGV